MAERSHAPQHDKNKDTIASTIVATENVRRTKKVYDVTDWYFEKSDLLETPSILDGMPVEAERRYRTDGARFIMVVGGRMELGHNTTSTGVVYFHRFYMFRSFQDFPHFVTACCCLFLAGKTEETPKKCRDIIAVAKSILTETQFATFGRDPKEEVMTLECILLQTIKFDLAVELPHTFLLKYVKCLKGDRRKLQKIAQMAWNFVNDSLSTVICLEWEPEVVAVALIQLASQCLKFNVVDWTGRQPHHRRWWDLFLGEMTMDMISEICNPVLDLYEDPSKGPMNHNMPKTAEVGASTSNKNNAQIKQDNAKKSTSEIELKAASASAALAALTVSTSNARSINDISSVERKEKQIIKAHVKPAATAAPPVVHRLQPLATSPAAQNIPRLDSISLTVSNSSSLSEVSNTKNGDLQNIQAIKTLVNPPAAPLMGMMSNTCSMRPNETNELLPLQRPNLTGCVPPPPVPPLFMRALPGIWSNTTPESQYFPMTTNLNGPPGPHVPPPGSHVPPPGPHVPLPEPHVPRGAAQMPDGNAGHYQGSSYMRHHHF